MFPATVVARRIGSVFDFATRTLNSRPEILNKLLAAISVVQGVSLALVNHRFHMLYASSNNTDQWVDVGLSGKLDRKGSCRSCGTIHDHRDLLQSSQLAGW